MNGAPKVCSAQPHLVPTRSSRGITKIKILSSSVRRKVSPASPGRSEHMLHINIGQVLGRRRKCSCYKQTEAGNTAAAGIED